MNEPLSFAEYMERSDVLLSQFTERLRESLIRGLQDEIPKVISFLLTAFGRVLPEELPRRVVPRQRETAARRPRSGPRRRR